MTFFQLIRKNLFRKKLRTILTTFAIFVAFAIFGILATFQNALNSGADTASADRLIVTNKINFTLPMPIAYASRVATVPGVKLVSHANWFGGYYQEPKNFLVALAIDPQSYLDLYPEYVLPPAQRAAFLGDRGSIIVGEGLAKQFNWKLGDRIPIKSNIFRKVDGSDTWDFTVAGIMTPGSTGVDVNFVAFHYEYFKQTRSFGGDTIGWLILRTESPKENERISRTIDAMFANSPFETETKTEQAFNKAFTEQLGDVGFIILLVVGAAFGTILLIVGNTMMLTVRERTNEIAVLKTIGFTADSIFRLVIGESLLLASIGGLLGLGAAYAASIGLAAVSGGRFGVMAFSPVTALIGVGIIVALGLLTGLLPALRAMNLNVVTALGRK
ncbi:MAG: FtsX-like permease family protein [Alphaproteobacteria bacterium]|nr:FtsX-like permease family protein [Alphaproteobacteria bacterium]